MKLAKTNGDESGESSEQNSNLYITNGGMRIEQVKEVVFRGSLLTRDSMNEGDIKRIKCKRDSR